MNLSVSKGSVNEGLLAFVVGRAGNDDDERLGGVNAELCRESEVALRSLSLFFEEYVQRLFAFGKRGVQ